MKRSRSGFSMLVLACAVSAVLMQGAGSAASAQTYPTKPLTMVVPYSPGGTADVVSRVVGQSFAAVAHSRLWHKREVPTQTQQCRIIGVKQT